MMKRLTLLSIVLVVVAGVAASANAESTPHRSAKPAESIGGKWIAYERDIAPANVANVRTIKGTEISGGCEFTIQASLAPGEKVLRREEIAYNAQTCQSKIAVSHAPAVRQPSRDSSRYSSDSGGGAAAKRAFGATTRRSEPSAASAIRSAGYYESWFEDVVNLDLNLVRNSTEWSWNGLRVLDNPVPQGSYYYYWFTLSGWDLLANNFTNVYNNTRTSVSSYAHFRNEEFCAFQETNAYYNRNRGSRQVRRIPPRPGALA